MLFPLLLFFVTICVVTDLRERKIYNKVILAGLVVALIANIVLYGFLSAMMLVFSGMFTGIILLIVPFLLGGLGAGDVKMLGMIGAFTGTTMTVHIFFASALVGGIFALFTLLKEGRFRMRMQQMSKAFYCAVFARNSFYLEGLHERTVTVRAIPYGVALAAGVLIIYIMGSMDYMLPGLSAAM
ncbi:MAG: prepilin peptidase [Firmicutes bacterium]|nr:prepilin peptidase [Bacillota bacterium]